MRENREGVLYSLVYGRPCSLALDPIEKKPLYHFLPGTASLSVATVGCNLCCRFCQNHTISQVRGTGALYGNDVPAEDVVTQARENGAASISYTYTEPTIFFEYAYDVGLAARTEDIRNVFVSNGFMMPAAAAKALDFLDAINVDLKCFRDETYKQITGGRLQPVLDTIRFFAEHGVWAEVTTLLVPDMNDSQSELEDIAAFLASVSPSIPWHVSRFHPTHQMTDRGPTPMAALQRALAAGRKAGLHYVYAGNVPGSVSENTFCPSCKAEVIGRFGFSSDTSGFEGGICGACARPVEGVWS